MNGKNSLDSAVAEEMKRKQNPGEAAPQADAAPAAPKQAKTPVEMIRYVLESLKLYQIPFKIATAKIPAQYRQYVGYVVLAIYLISIVCDIVIPIFFPDVAKSFNKSLKKDLKDLQPWMPLLIGLSWLVIVSPIAMMVGSYIWRTKRETNMAEINKKFLESKRTVILRPRGDDKSKWRESYAGFWGVIHRCVRVKDQEIYLEKTPFMSFEMLRFGPWLKANSRPDFAVAVTATKEHLATIMTQLQSMHNDMVVEYPEQDLLDLTKEGDIKVMYQDFSPTGAASAMLSTETKSMDHFRMLATALKDISTGVYSAGVQVLVRDSLNAYSELSDYAFNMQYTADNKRKPIDKMNKGKIESIETKKIYSSEDVNYDIVIRLYVIGKSEGEMKMMMVSMSEWIQQISGSNPMTVINQGEDLETLMNRTFPSKIQYLESISPIELAPVWHIPDVEDQVPNMARAAFRMLAPSQNAILQPGEPARPIGYYPTSNGEKLMIGLRQTGKNPDVFFHAYGVGPTGVGKSVLLQNLIVADMNMVHEPTGKPWSVIVLEPHEDLTADILERVPDNREGDVVIIDPVDKWPVGLNMFDTSGRPEDVESDTYNVVSVFRKAFGSSWDQAVRMQRWLINSIQTTMTVLPRRRETPTILHLQAFISNMAYRQYVIQGLSAEDGTMFSEWMNFMGKAEQEQMSILDPAITRVNKFLNNQILRRIIAQPQMSLNFKELMDNGTIVLAKMNNKMGEDNRALLGSLLVSFIFKTAMSRGSLDIKLRQPCGFFIDEFQTFVGGTGEELKAILAEARKMRLGMTMANQFFNQLPADVRDAVANNTGTKIIFRAEPQDARLFEPFFAGRLAQSDFGLNRYMAHVKLMAKANPEMATVYTFDQPPKPKTADVQPNNRDLDKDTAKAMGVDLRELSGMPSNGREAIGHVMALSRRAEEDPEIHARLTKLLVQMPDDMFGQYQNLRKEWANTQRGILLKDPGYITVKRHRIEQLSRLRVGIPTYEIDSMIGRLNTKLQALMDEAKEGGDGGDGGAADMGETDFFDFDSSGGKGGGKGKSAGSSKGGGEKAGKGDKGKKKDDVSFDTLFDSF